jgi:hypothetical protein
MPRGQRDGSLRPYSQFSRPEPLLILNFFFFVLASLYVISVQLYTLKVLM